MHRRSRSSFVVVALMLVMALVWPAAAFAALEDAPMTESRTNPNVGDGVTWRWSWGNSWFPDMIVTTVPADGTAEERKETLGFLYEINQLSPSRDEAIAVIGSDVPTWTTSFLSPRPEGTTLTDVFDIKSHVSGPAGWTQYPGAAKSGEGVYGVSFLFYNQFRVEDPSGLDFRFRGLDFTNPSSVQGLEADSLGAPSTSSGWTETRKRNIKWDGSVKYDALSGVGGFALSVNGEEKLFAQNRAPKIGWEPYAALLNHTDTDTRGQLSHVTVEDLPAGPSTVGITVVDRATNRSSTKTVKALVDYDTPKVSISSPAAGEVVSPKPTFTVKAEDAAGITQVKYYVDDVLVGTAKSAPFSLKADLSQFSNGGHTLKVKAYDQIGELKGSKWEVDHIASATRSFKIDKTPPSITKVSANYTTFYPRKRDGYKDNLKVKFTVNEPGTAKLTIKNSKGKVVRTVKKSITKAGATSITWNGKYTDGSVKAGTFSYKLSMTDKAGNSSSAASRKVTIKFYELVRTSSNSLRVIER